VSGRLALRDGLVLVAPGAVFVPAESTLIVADTHAGLPSELRARGHAVPIGDDEALIAKLRAMVTLTEAETVVVAGDLLHGPGSLARDPLGALVAALPASRLRIVRGNHDRRAESALDARAIEHDTALAVGPHWVTHGDDVERVRALRALAHEAGGRVLVGHIHPAFALDDGEGARRVCPAFVTARALVCLPALSVWARGGDVRSRAVKTQLTALSEGDPMGVAVIVGDRVLPIGPL
jgi:putative SbcD/Mre11-related phosphoesterase